MQVHRYRHKTSNICPGTRAMRKSRMMTPIRKIRWNSHKRRAITIQRGGGRNNHDNLDDEHGHLEGSEEEDAMEHFEGGPGK
jgi:hypothetical protein